jgi:outer membrane lipopolysaccharide assembly protein LptE/RlpB
MKNATGILILALACVAVATAGCGLTTAQATQFAQDDAAFVASALPAALSNPSTTPAQQTQLIQQSVTVLEDANQTIAATSQVNMTVAAQDAQAVIQIMLAVIESGVIPDIIAEFGPLFGNGHPNHAAIERLQHQYAVHPPPRK